MGQSESARFNSGLGFALIAYTWWGLIPLYFNELKGVSPGEILSHRIVWSVVLIVGVTTLTGGWRRLFGTLASPRLVLTLLVSALLLAVNWLLYIYAITYGRLTEASLGYYMLPLVNAFLATVFLGEKLRPAHYPALALVAVGVLVPIVALGLVPWLTLGLAVSFGLYGLVRKMIVVESFTGLSVETLLLVGPSAAYLVHLSQAGEARFGDGVHQSVFLALGGVVTVVPLLTFTLAIRRLPLLALTMIQVLSPTLQLAIAVAWNGEAVPGPVWVAIGCVWLAVIIFIADAINRGLPPRVFRP